MSAAEKLLSQAPLFTDDVTYLVVHAPARAIIAAAGILAEISEPFSALIADKDEVTLVIAAEHWEEFGHRLAESRLGGEYRLITFDLPLPSDLLGFLALVGRILADAGVSILAFSACERDHILVPAPAFQAAWDALRAAQARLSG